MRYNTGTFTTGRDWWAVSWFSADLSHRSYSSPNNFRAAFDGGEAVADALISKLVDAARDVAADNEDLRVRLAGPMLIKLGKEVAAPLFNSEGTDGFKQHILREEDADRQTVIELHGDGSIQFPSRSGDSATVYKTVAK